MLKKIIESGALDDEIAKYQRKRSLRSMAAPNCNMEFVVDLTSQPLAILLRTKGSSLDANGLKTTLHKMLPSAQPGLLRSLGLIYRGYLFEYIH